MTKKYSGFGQLEVNPLSEQNADKRGLREERYSLALRVANDGLWEWDLEKNEISYSAKWKSMLGFKDDEIGPFLIGEITVDDLKDHFSLVAKRLYRIQVGGFGFK